MSSKKERVIVQAIGFCVSAFIGYKIADKIYTKTLLTYMRIFHKDEYIKAWTEAMNETIEELK